MTTDRAGWKRVKRKTIEVYRIAFSYRGAECRETIVLPHTKSNDNYVSRLRAEILGKIARNDFNYAEFFPESSRAGEFGRGARRSDKLKPLLEAYRDRVKHTLEPSTYDAYRKAIDYHLVPWCGDMRPPELRPSVVREWISLQTVSMKTIANRLLPLRAVLDEAVEDEVIAVNPLRVVQLRKIVPKDRRESKFAPDPYTEAELLAILAELGEHRWLFQFWAFTGVRTGELIGLRWKRVDLGVGAVSIQETTTLNVDKDKPKTKAGVRTIGLLPGALQALRFAVPADGAVDSERVFLNPVARQESGAWTYRSLVDVWKAASERAGVRYRNPYQLRHTFASQLLSQGENPARIATLLGHKNIEMVTRAYGRWIADGKAGTPRRWGETIVELAAA
jgi:integrase